MRKYGVWALSTLFIGAGVLHLLRPKPFLQIMPPGIPAPRLMVILSGIAEIIGGVGIAIPPTRPAARWGLVVLLIAVFPANIYMAQQNIQPGGMHTPQWLLWVRLLLQPALIWWVLSCTSKTVPQKRRAAP